MDNSERFRFSLSSKVGGLNGSTKIGGGTNPPITLRVASPASFGSGSLRERKTQNS